MSPFIQIQSISLTNFKNVEKGSVDFKNGILGVYGQNGSGKTALIDTLDLFQRVARGKSITAEFEYAIMCDKEFAEIEISFEVFNEKKELKKLLVYVFQIRPLKKDDNQNGGIEIIREQLFEQEFGKRKKILIISIDKSLQEKWITPASKWSFAFTNKESSIKVEVLKEITGREHRSLLFSKELADFVSSSKENASFPMDIYKIKSFAEANFFVVKSCGNSPFNLDFSFPFNIKYSKENAFWNGNVKISLVEPTVFPKELFELVNGCIKEMNIVLKEIVPGLQVIVKNEGAQQTTNGTDGVRFELLSKKADKKEIPLRFESEGIKKIISILSILVSVYNNPETFLAVDELDAGVYEYLLGELLNIIEEKAKGKLLFTSHNLRPLEMIKKESLIFTTTNSQNRYIRLTGIQKNNNPRNVYLRSINLGGQKEVIYQETNHFNIDRAFRNAGNKNHG